VRIRWRSSGVFSSRIGISAWGRFADPDSFFWMQDILGPYPSKANWKKIQSPS
jgi:hypothetical protein